MSIDLNCHIADWQCSTLLSPEVYAQVRQKMMLEGFKWDAQIGDVNALSPFALVLPAQTWHHLAAIAEQLTAEMLNAEDELKQRLDLQKLLGLPHRVRQAMSISADWTPSAARVSRFDFHPTSEGWRISEVNSDVPGGYTEASIFSQQMASLIPGTTIAGNPAKLLVDALTETATNRGAIAFLSAPGYLEDQQITSYLAHLAQQRGCTAYLAHPHQVEWQNGKAYLNSGNDRLSLDAILRFYQGEWLEKLSQFEWRHFFRGGETPVCNPGSALLVESKRFPLVWHQLSTPLPTWKALLPKTYSPFAVNWMSGSRWVLKTAFCNTGETVQIPGMVTRNQYARSLVKAWLHSNDWIAQQEFETLAIQTPIGIMYPCIGVYTINGKAAGIYGRIAPNPLVNFAAIDIAVLVQAEARGDKDNGQAASF